MKKSDLKSGMVVETIEGYLYLVVGDILIRDVGYLNLSSYHDDLKHTVFRDFNIIKIYNYKLGRSFNRLLEYNNLELVWESKEQNTQLTQEQIKILKALKTLGFNYIARDKDYDLYAHMNKPHKDNIEWNNDSSLMPLDFLTVGFEFIKWSDDEPTKIDDLL